jgi:4-aminobutyrate aminotransferase-like enzyme
VREQVVAADPSNSGGALFGDALDLGSPRIEQGDGVWLIDDTGRRYLDRIS